MKLLVCVLALAALVQGEIDWSKVKPASLNLPVRGFPGFGARITGGEEVEPNSLPYQAALLISTNDGTYFCGGSLISRNYVVTAAHCVDKANEVEVILGAHRVRETEPKQIRYKSKQVTVHDGWNQLRLINDIALVRLPELVPLTDEIKVVKLPKYSDVGTTFSGIPALASGWGKDSDEAETISEVLRSVVSEVITNAICSLRYLGVVKDTHICTSGKDTKSTCSGDSGGPLVIEGKLVGIVSFGIAFGCEKGWPPVFTRVTSYLDWLAAHSDVVIEK